MRTRSVVRLDGGWLALSGGVAASAGFYLDASVQSWIAQHQDAEHENFMRGVSRFGDWPEHVALGLILLVLAYWRGSKRWMRIFAAMMWLRHRGRRRAGVKIVDRSRPAVSQDGSRAGTARNSARATTRFLQGTPRPRLRFSPHSLGAGDWRIGLPYSSFRF